MPTNANTFNSRVTSEALEAKYRQVFPAQGGAELVQDLFASGVIQPVIDFSSVAEGSFLPSNLQTAWDFSTGHQTARNTSPTLISNPGFWQVNLNAYGEFLNGTNLTGTVSISDGLSSKIIWEINSPSTPNPGPSTLTSTPFVVFLRTGDSLIASSNNLDLFIDVWYRQIADVNGNLVNPLGFVFT